jgi:hypothetical protein
VHNPYDEKNFVTNVHPSFYSERLRNLTDCLVYVPYFVGDGKSIQEHFCTLPGCIFAHKVIVQTEQEWEIYVKVYKEFAKKNNTPEQFDRIANKFLALGSPKLDKVVSAKCDDFEIPEKWEKLINNADGTRKKIVFYNTSIGALLENTVEDNKPSNKYLQKIKSVFEFFKTQHDAVLLWRPHPLLESTIKSMRQWLEQEYAEIVEEYKNGGYGIYDDSEDLNRAVMLSDMYYGDTSSVTNLFKVAEKPAVWQGFDTEKKQEIILHDNGFSTWFMDCLSMLLINVHNDYEIPAEWEKLINSENGVRKKVIFYYTGIHALLKFSAEDDKSTNKYLQKVKSVFKFFKKQKDAILLWYPHPLLESTIKKMCPYLEQEYTEIMNEYKSGNYGIYDDSQNLNRAVALSDIYYGDWSGVINLFEKAEKPVIGQNFEAVAHIFTGIYDDGNSVWLMNVLNMLYKHDKQNKEIKCMGVIAGQPLWAYMGITEYNKKLYFAPGLANKISAFEMDKKCFEQIDFEYETEVKKIKFSDTVCFKNYVYFIPLTLPTMVRLNTGTNEVEYFSKYVDEISKIQTSKLLGNKGMFLGTCAVDMEIAMAVNGANAIMFFNMETGSYEIKKIGEITEQYNAISFDGKNYYISLFYKNYIVKWNRQSNEILKIKFPASFSRKENEVPNFLIRYFNGCIWLLPQAANNAYKINTSTNEITELPELTEHFENKDLRWFYNRIFTNENLIYASTMNKGIAAYNINTHELNFIKPDLEAEPLLYSALYDYYNMKNKLEMVVENKNFGKKIWEYFKK